MIDRSTELFSRAKLLSSEQIVLHKLEGLCLLPDTVDALRRTIERSLMASKRLKGWAAPCLRIVDAIPRPTRASDPAATGELDHEFD